MRIFISIIILATIALFAFLLLKTTETAIKNVSLPPTEKAIERKLTKERIAWKNLHFELVDPEQAPKLLRETVEAGFRLMIRTHELLPHYVQNPVNCTSCHFGGGISIGGLDAGISLAGAAAAYPKYDPLLGRVVDLPERVNLCFKNSMNGLPLPLDSQEMLAIITYLHWISLNFPIYMQAPWLGVKPLKSSHVPDKKHGEKNYKTFCADCHGADGKGGNYHPDDQGSIIPALWGNHSFNSQAGMNRPDIFASFIYHNMPYDEPHLSSDEALDITTFILAQPRS